LQLDRIFWRADADPVLLDGDDGAVEQVIAVAHDSVNDHLELQMHRVRDKAKQSSVRIAVPHDEIPEVLVERHQYPTMPVCIVQDGTIARIYGPIVNGLNIMTGLAEISSDRSPDG